MLQQQPFRQKSMTFGAKTSYSNIDPAHTTVQRRYNVIATTVLFPSPAAEKKHVLSVSETVLEESGKIRPIDGTRASVALVVG